jgi:hypothetical protein
MGRLQNIEMAQRLLEGLGHALAPEEIASPFDADLEFEIQGDVSVLPWIGRKTGRSGMADFVRDIRAMTEPVTFDVEDILQVTAAPQSLGRCRRGSRQPVRSQ